MWKLTVVVLSIALRDGSGGLAPTDNPPAITDGGKLSLIKVPDNRVHRGRRLLHCMSAAAGPSRNCCAAALTAAIRAQLTIPGFRVGHQPRGDAADHFGRCRFGLAASFDVLVNSGAALSMSTATLSIAPAEVW